jgi:SprT protein
MLTEKVKAKVKEIYDKAEKTFGREFVFPTITFDLEGTRAGEAHYKHNLIKFNYRLLSENFDAFMKETCAHEVAHLLVRTLYSNTKKHHGPEFFAVGQRLGYNLSTHHTFDTSSVRKRGAHKYYCKCREHIVSTTLHNKIENGSKRTCKKCGASLSLVKGGGAAISMGARMGCTIF